ncbi:hypothetical protein [Pedobacter sp. UYP1]|uniref:hypothetical protein n=1 Tax=Pedobacter sp. UYP1 TaxID=1756396 RepID=UPI003397C556
MWYHTGPDYNSLYAVAYSGQMQKQMKGTKRKKGELISGLYFAGFSAEITVKYDDYLRLRRLRQ